MNQRIKQILLKEAQKLEALAARKRNEAEKLQREAKELRDQAKDD